MDTVFNFLATKTDFYTNDEGRAEQLVLTSFKKYKKIAAEEKLKKQQERERLERQRKEKQKNEAMQNSSNKITELTDEEAKELEKEIEMKKLREKTNNDNKVDGTGDAKEAEDDEEVLLICKKTLHFFFYKFLIFH